MRTSRLKWLSASLSFLIAASFFAAPLGAAEIERLFSFTAGRSAHVYDLDPDLAVQPGGSYLLTSKGATCFGCNVGLAQRFDAAGRPLAPANSLGHLVQLKTAALPDGGFVALGWFDFSLTPQGVGLHRLDGLGRQVGATIAVAYDTSSFTLNLQPRVAVSSAGAVAVVWLDPTPSTDFQGKLKASFYDANLRPIAEGVHLSSPESQVGEFDPEVAFAPDGTALVAWRRYLSPSQTQIFGRRFAVTGQPLSEPFPISTLEPSHGDFSPRLIARPGGGWWAVWSHRILTPTFRAPLLATEEIRFVRLDGDGRPVGTERPVPDLHAAFPFSAAVDQAGRLLVLGSRNELAVGRMFDHEGNESSNLIEISGTATVRDPTLTSGRTAGFLAAWAGSLPQSGFHLAGSLVAPTCLEGKNAACLGPDGRFAVEVAWRNGSQSGTAKPLPLAGNAATFGLRNVADHEVTVILGGSGARDLTFAATTGAELEIRVTDKTTGMVSTFTKPAGRFASQRFLDALPSASSAFGEALPSAAETAATPAIAPVIGELCVPTSRALCLLGGRFRAELLAGANPRPALAILRTDRSGTFAFPSAAETPLVVLTMKDGRAANGKFWVYLGGLSRAAYKVKITDLSTGAEKVYSNPVGRLESRADRTAF